MVSKASRGPTSQQCTWCTPTIAGISYCNDWPNSAIKVVADTQVPGNVWTHVAVTYDGSGKAAGMKVYYNGKSQPTKVESDGLNGSFRNCQIDMSGQFPLQRDGLFRRHVPRMQGPDRHGEGMAFSYATPSSTCS